MSHASEMSCLRGEGTAAGEAAGSVAGGATGDLKLSIYTSIDSAGFPSGGDEDVSGGGAGGASGPGF